ncbi:MAG TPA: hypothetical protein VMM12_14660 [Longimicrobiales bacterium]|nr:hypothetical protein [Longimicrobiales bacterium]
MAESTNGPERETPASGEAETTRATGMGEPGQFRGVDEPSGPVDRARSAAGGKLEDTARRVRELGDRAAVKNRALERARPLAHNAADGLDNAARYVRERELDAVRSDLEAQVRRHPLASIALAFVAGYTLRRLF